MKKIVLLALVSMLLSTALVVGFVRPVAAQGTIYISANGSVEGTDKIQRVGDVYTFTDNIYDSIVVERDNIIINGAGYVVQGTDSGTGIDLSSRSNVTVKNTIVTNFSYGIYLYGSHNNTFVNNTIEYDSEGIFLYNSRNNRLVDNTATINTYGILLLYSSNNAVTENNASDNVYGIYLEESKDNTVVGNYASNNNYGITQWESSNNNIIRGNTVSNNWAGIYLGASKNNTVVGNTASGNEYGVSLGASSNNIVTGNNASYNDHGIYLYSSSNNNTVTCNIFYSNEWIGIKLGGSNSNRFSGNTVYLNVMYGVYFEVSNNNKFFHNNFNNTQQVEIAGFPTSRNVWDEGYPSGGNYWSDYTGWDNKIGPSGPTGSDGIGESPYHVVDTDYDYFPLMGPFNTFNAGIWDGTAYNIDIVSNSTISDFYFNPEEGTFIRFNVTGEEETAGFCRVTIPKQLLWAEDGWTVLVDTQLVIPAVVPTEDYTYLCITYSQSTKNVEIQGTHVISEFFPTWTSMLLILILLTVIIAIYKRRLPKTPIH